ncbi:hypothetical protein QVD17_30212 [Tagetes erecta]|uniref:Uncharacterized protein n=1 Tax=Tagetes erecta TaxID=13708 RepID=A0AAD8NN86_TARER|nr:hypothetical protein QVD17_30212 [Tagetes erecta]
MLLISTLIGPGPLLLLGLLSGLSPLLGRRLGRIRAWRWSPSIVGPAIISVVVPVVKILPIVPVTVILAAIIITIQTILQRDAPPDRPSSIETEYERWLGYLTIRVLWL